MGISFTKKQQEVIDARGCNLLVAAAAGSGKTAVLVERIVKMVSDGADPVDIDRLLVVTFTNAAAAEMRERISRALNDRLAADPENEHLQRQVTLLHNARITTIDSFCLFVLRNQFHTIGLDPGFRIAEEGEGKLMRQEALEAVADRAVSREIGARGLRAILEEVMNQIMYDIPSDPTIVKVIITESCVRDGAGPELVRDPERTQRPKLGKAAVQVEKSGPNGRYGHAG